MDSDPTAAIDTLESMTGLNGPQLDEKDRLVSKAKTKQKEIGTAANRELTQLLGRGQLTYDQVEQRSNSLNDTDFLKWTKIAIAPTEKAGNPVKMAELKSMARSVHRNAMTRDQLDEAMKNSMADPAGINASQFAEVSAVADTSIKTGQAEDIRRFYRQAQGVIMGKYNSVISVDAMGNFQFDLSKLDKNQTDEVKQRLHFLGQYEQGLYDFIADNPKASGKEFAQFAAEQKMRYWNTSIETIESLAQEQGFGGSDVTAVPTAEELRATGTPQAWRQGVDLGYWTE
jgi:hypothetical protein